MLLRLPSCAPLLRQRELAAWNRAKRVKWRAHLAHFPENSRCDANLAHAHDFPESSIEAARSTEPPVFSLVITSATPCVSKNGARKLRAY